VFAFPDSAYSESYLLGEAFESRALRVGSVDASLDAHALTRGTSVPEAPLAFVRSGGALPLDILGTTWAVLLIVSDDFLRVLSENSFTGWRTYPVHIRAFGKEVVGYHGLAITGRAATPDWSRSPVVDRLPFVPGGQPYKTHIGIFITGNLWDGSDLFLPEGTSLVIVRQRVADALRQARVSNVLLRQLDTFQREWAE
jgi:hypothetical protein